MAKYVLEDMVKTKRARKSTAKVVKQEPIPVENIEPEELKEVEEVKPRKTKNKPNKNSKHALWVVAFA